MNKSDEELLKQYMEAQYKSTLALTAQIAVTHSILMTMLADRLTSEANPALALEDFRERAMRLLKFYCKDQDNEDEAIRKAQAIFDSFLRAFTSGADFDFSSFDFLDPDSVK